MSEKCKPNQADYSRLEYLLIEKNWKLADDETRSLMCRVVGREAVPHLTPEAVRVFPYEILDAIDILWATNSEGRFGFRAQRKLWRECGGIGAILDFGKMEGGGKAALAETERKFVRRVGWVDARCWTGDSSSLPVGYLPYSCLMCSYGHGLIGLVTAALALRFGDASSNT